MSKTAAARPRPSLRVPMPVTSYERMGVGHVTTLREAVGWGTGRCWRKDPKREQHTVLGPPQPYCSPQDPDEHRRRYRGRVSGQDSASASISARRV